MVGAFEPAEDEPEEAKRTRRRRCCRGRVRLDVQVLQLAGSCWKRGSLEDDVVLVDLRVHGVDLALAEGVIERVVDGRGRDAEARRRDAVDDE